VSFILGVFFMREQKMKPLRSKIKWLMAVILLFTFIILKIHFTLTAKPKITVDYIAEYNRITRPSNYDPNDNAASYYQKAFNAFLDMPKELQDLYKNWPTDFNSIEQAKLEGWLNSNAHALEYFKIAANKPYYWLERSTGKDRYMISMSFPELEPLQHLTEALLWNAKLAASKGRLQIAFDNIIDCYRTGCQKCRTPSDVSEQSDGMKFKSAAVDTALIILDKIFLNSSTFKSFQNTLQLEFNNDIYIPDFTAEKLYLYDTLQRTFVDNGRGTGRLAWPVAYPFDMGCEHMQRETQANCFTGPTRKQIVKQIENVSAIFNQIMTKSPSQIENEGCDYFEEITNLKIHNFFFQLLLLEPDDTFHLYYETKAQTEALIAVLAILRFKADNHRLPASLDELVSADYLKSVPMDPYSDGPLVYKSAEDNFKLYSVGENFSDDGGSNEIDVRPLHDGRGKVYVIPDKRPPDIAYWPIKKLKKLPPEPTDEQMKKRRAEKEVDILRTIPDPYHPDP
jgi:hypothetical protein